MATITFHIHPDPAWIAEFHKSLTPRQEQLSALGLFLLSQVQERFKTQGVSGGTPWMPKRMKSFGYDDGRAILTGHSARLLDSFQSYGTKTDAVVFSDLPYAHVHQLGTAKYGGPIPTIVPKKAKALFIPITDRAISSQRIEGQQAAHFRAATGGIEPARASMTALRVPTRGKKITRDGVKYFSPLVKGRLKDGKLERWNDVTEEYEPGTPDFIFLRSVSIPPRPMLPTSGPEQRAQQEFIADMLTPGNATQSPAVRAGRVRA